MEIYKIFLISILVTFFGCKQKIEKNNSSSKKTFVLQGLKERKKYPEYLDENYVLGKFNYKNDSFFVKVPSQLSSKEVYIRKEVLKAFTQMCKSAKKEGVRFSIISGTRNYAHQKKIWDWKWNQKFKNIPVKKRALKILEYSSMPSTSRHHWGTDIDLNNLNNSYFESGRGVKEYQWLMKNAFKFGFYQVYTSKNGGRTGYNEEKWHWSYAPLSVLYLKFYNENISNQDIKGFEGEIFVSEIDMVANYVNGINHNLLNYRLR